METVITPGALDEFTGTEPRFKSRGVTLILGTIPVPVSVIDAVGSSGSLDDTSRPAVLLPAEDGLKVTWSVAFSPGASVVPEALSLEILNWSKPAPAV